MVTVVASNHIFLLSSLAFLSAASDSKRFRYRGKAPWRCFSFLHFVVFFHIDVCDSLRWGKK